MAWRDRTGWMAYDGTEIINSARLQRYLGIAGCGTFPPGLCVPCPDLIREVSDPPFSDPIVDDAPWYDPARPESKDFLGIGGIDIAGIAAQPSEEDAGVWVRDVQFTVVLAARNDMALSYGLSWLSVALQGAYCPLGSCVGGEMCVAIACPTFEAPDPVRTLFDTYVLERPNVTQVMQVQQFTFWTVEFTVRSRNEYLFQDPEVTLQFEPIRGPIGTVDLPAIYEQCLDPEPCGQDPDCARPEIPIVPDPPVDACYPSDPFRARRLVAAVDTESVPQWLELVPMVRVYAGNQPVRNLTIRFYQNPLGIECSDVTTVDPCMACTDITIAYLPSGSTTRIDGRIRRAITECLSPMGVDVDVPPLYGPAGQTFVWPSFSCGYGLCVEMTVAVGVASDAEVEVGFYTRQVAA